MRLFERLVCNPESLLAYNHDGTYKMSTQLAQVARWQVDFVRVFFLTLVKLLTPSLMKLAAKS